MYKTIVDFGEFTVEDTDYKEFKYKNIEPEYDIDYYEELRKEKLREKRKRNNDEQIMSAIISVIAPIIMILCMIVKWIIFGY